MFVLPSITTPACSSRSTTVALYGETKLSSIREPQAVFTPAVQKMSLCASGMPVSGVALPCARRRSAAAACPSACSAVTVTKAFSGASKRSIRLKKWRVSSVAETRRA